MTDFNSFDAEGEVIATSTVVMSDGYIEPSDYDVIDISEIDNSYISDTQKIDIKADFANFTALNSADNWTGSLNGTQKAHVSIATIGDNIDVVAKGRVYTDFLNNETDIDTRIEATVDLKGQFALESIKGYGKLDFGVDDRMDIFSNGNTIAAGVKATFNTISLGMPDFIGDRVLPTLGVEIGDQATALKAGFDFKLG